MQGQMTADQVCSEGHICTHVGTLYVPSRLLHDIFLPNADWAAPSEAHPAQLKIGN